MAKYAKPGSSRDQREIAMACVICDMRDRLGWVPEEHTDEEAWMILNELYARDHQSFAGKWLKAATDSQEELFCKEWRARARKWQQGQWNRAAVERHLLHKEE